MVEANKKETKESLIVPLVILIFLASTWFVYTCENQIWLSALQQVASWIANPTINYTPLQIEGIPLAFLATVEILILGVISSHTLLANEKDMLIKFCIDNWNNKFMKEFKNTLQEQKEIMELQ